MIQPDDASDIKTVFEACHKDRPWKGAVYGDSTNWWPQNGDCKCPQGSIAKAVKGCSLAKTDHQKLALVGNRLGSLWYVYCHLS